MRHELTDLARAGKAQAQGPSAEHLATLTQAQARYDQARADLTADMEGRAAQARADLAERQDQ
jgi:hypothetical protein